MTLQSQRHVGGPAHFDDAEAASFGPTLRHLEKVLAEITGACGSTPRPWARASRTSTATWSRGAETPNDAKAWGVFDLSQRAAEGSVQVDEREVDRIVEAFRARVASGVPPLAASPASA